MATRPSRVIVYFTSLLATIGLINTPVPRAVISVLLNPEAGEVVARSLSSVTKDLVLVLLVSLYFEWARTKEQTELAREINRKIDRMAMMADEVTSKAIREIVLESTSAKDLVVAALDKVMLPSDDKAALAVMLLSDRPVYRDVSIAMRIEHVEGESLVVGTRFEATVPKGHVLIAATCSPTHTAALSAACPELFDVVTLPQSTPFTEAARTFGANLQCYVEPRNGVTQLVEFKRLPMGSQRKYISLPVGMVPADVVLYGADLRNEEAELLRLRYRFRWDQDISDHFLYWFADRTMFVRTITLDVRELVRDRALQVWVQVFLGSVDSLTLDANDGHLSLTLDRWIIEGQGVVVVW